MSSDTSVHDTSVHDTSVLDALPLAEPGRRGSLTIAPKVVERLAQAASSDVRGTADYRGGLDRFVGRALPRAEGRVAGSHASLSLEVAAVWPHSVPDVTRSVRDAVIARVGALAGLTVDRVDVTVAHVLTPDESTPERRRVQ